MKKNYCFSNRTHSPIQNKNSVNLRLCLTMLFSFFFILVGYAQKGKNDVILHTCIQDIGNGLFRAEFGYTNPTNKDITVGEDDSVVFLSDQDNDDDIQGIQKILGITTFEPGTHDKAFGVVFNSSGHAKWTVTFNGNNETKVRANAASTVCIEPCVVCPVFGGAGKSFTPLGAELTALATNNAGENPSNIIYQINDQEEVLIEIVPKDGRMQFVLELLQGPLPNGFERVYDIDPLLTDFIVDPDIIAAKYATIDVYFPISRLLELNDYPGDLNFSRSLYTPIRQVGVANTKGDDAMFTNKVRESFVLRNEDGTPIPLDGTGIKVGVISDSFKKQPFTEDPELGQVSKDIIDVKNRDLPGDLDAAGNVVFDAQGNVQNGVNILKDYPYGIASDEGRAMSQLIHDVAPGAEMGFYTGVLSPRDLALGIEIMSNDGYMIITDDITYPLEPFYDDPTTIDDDGQISKAIKDFTSDGGIYVTAAGNFTNTGHQSVFVNSTATPITNPSLTAGTRAHVFGTNPDGSQDVLQELEVDLGTYFLVLQWDEDQASQNNIIGAATDLDIYILSNTGQVLVNTNRTNKFGDAVEAVIFQSLAENALANIMITSADGPAPANLAFRYIVFSSDGLQIMEYNTGTPTVTGHAMTQEAITVGAVDYRLALKGQPLIPEFFSSYAGNLLNGTILQVDIAAPDGGNTTVLSVGNDIDDPTEDTPDDPEILPNFFGTSAAAPHVAGAAALLLSTALPPSEPEAYSPSWYPNGLPVGVLQLFQDNAIAMPGAETQAGSGLINAVAAFKQIAVQTAVLNDFIVVTEGEIEPGVDTYDVTISGNYIPTDAEVFLGNDPLVIVGDPSEIEITATVGPFVGNPELTVFTNSGDLPGGGNSNGLSILPDGKIALNIIANNITVEFGNTPQFTYKLQGLPGYEEVVFGLPGGETLNDALADLGLQLLPDIILTSTATGPYPDVGFYSISGSFSLVELTSEQLAAYQINFINTGEEAGRLTVSRKDLIVRPTDVFIEYGEAVEVVLNYFGVGEEGEEITLESGLFTAIDNAHALDFYTDNDPNTNDNTLLLINKLRAVVNSEDILNLLNNGSSWMASDRIITNKLRAVVNGEMNLIDLETQNFDNYFTLPDLPIGNKLRAVVNKLRAVVNGQDLLNGDMQLQLIPENAEEEAIPNKLRAVVNSTSLLNQEGESGFGAYNKIFAVVDFEDGSPTDENGDPIDPEDPSFNKVWATNLLSSLDVTPAEEPSKVYPGAILSNFGVNFNTQYQSANITVIPATLTVQTPNMEIEYGTTLTIEDINSVISGYVYGETQAIVFPDDEGGIPYYFVKEGGDGAELEIDALKDLGDYLIKIGNPQNYTITNIVDETYGTLTVNKAVLYVETEDLVIDEGASIDTANITATITGYVYNETQGDVFPVGLQYSIEDVEGNPYTPGVTGVYFIKIMEPQNYVIEYIRIGTVYINPINNLRKIRTYTDCVEDNPEDPDDLFYIAHFRYVNPNDEAIYILEGTEENRLTGTAINSGGLPIKFLPGEHTFEIRFDGNTLKWELTSMDSNHKTSTTTNVNANFDKCDSNNTTNDSGIPSYILHPNPVNGILYIEQDISAMVTLDVFDLYGMPIESLSNTTLDGTIAPSTHPIDMIGLEQGMYFIRLSANDIDDVQVFSVVKE